MNELKLMAIKAKSRLLNKGLREIYSCVNVEQEKANNDVLIIPSLDYADENTRKRELLNRLKSRFN